MDPTAHPDPIPASHTPPKFVELNCSGYTDQAVLRNALGDARNNFVQKPFTPERLVKAVREVLDARKANFSGLVEPDVQRRNPS